MNAEAGDVTFGQEGATFSSWRIRKDAFYRAGSVLLVAKLTDGSEFKLIAEFAGTAIWMNPDLKPDYQIQKGEVVLKYTSCPHLVVMKDLCADCGMNLRRWDGATGERKVETRANVAMIHNIPELQITPEEAKLHGAADEANLVKLRKLVLLVDLDQTLIHTTNEAVSADIADVFHYQLYGPQSQWYHTRLRPNTRRFLSNVARLYELHICTFGQRRYAHRIAAELDPDGSLFGHRILSRDECFDGHSKTANLNALFPCGDRLVAIIDDREDVWQFAPNVIHVKPYRFFKHTGDINAPAGFDKSDENTEHQFQFVHPHASGKDAGEADSAPQPSTSAAAAAAAATHDGEFPNVSDSGAAPTVVDDDDDYLLHLEDVLTRVHSAFYHMFDRAAAAGGQPPEMRSVVPYVKSKVLRGVRLVFSAVIPTTVAAEKTPIYRAARAFGADVQPDVVAPSRRGGRPDERCTTHLVGAKWGTSKANRAVRSSRIHLVRPQWLWCCIERWQRADEGLYKLTEAQQDKIADVIECGLAPRDQKKIADVATDAADKGGAAEVDVAAKLDDGLLELPAVSSSLLTRMSTEVDDALSEDDDDGAAPTLPGDSSSDDDSLSGQTPRAWKRTSGDLLLDQRLDGAPAKRRAAERASDSDASSDAADESQDSADDEMAAALEKQLNEDDDD